MTNAMYGISRWEDAVKLVDAKDQEIHRLRHIITAAYDDLRENNGEGAYAILRTAVMAFPSIPPAPAARLDADPQSSVAEEMERQRGW